MWPFHTPKLCGYLGTQGLCAWLEQSRIYRDSQQKLSNEQVKELESSIQGEGRLPKNFRKHQSILRLAPSLAPCYALPATSVKLGQDELKAVSEHWAKTFMGKSHADWVWQTVQTAPNEALLMAACKVSPNYLNSFETVKPDLLYLLDSIHDCDSSWIVCSDDLLVQSALVKNGKIVSVCTWPIHYGRDARSVIERHSLLRSHTSQARPCRIFESYLGEVSCHDAI